MSPFTVKNDFFCMQTLTSNDEIVVGAKGKWTVPETSTQHSDVGEYDESTSSFTVRTNEYFLEKSMILFLIGEILIAENADTSVNRLKFVKVCGVVPH